MNSFERSHEEKLPARKFFYSSKKDGKIADDGKITDGHVIVKYCLMCGKIWDKLEMKNMGDYHNHYFKKDVLLLADAFQNFIATCLKCYGFDSCHYFSYVELSWNVIFKITGVKLEKISDNNKYLFIEKEFRERISYNAKRYAKANNKCLNAYSPKKTVNIYITLDINSLYCLAMNEYLLYERLKWLKNVDEFDVMSISEKKSDRIFSPS